MKEQTFNILGCEIRIQKDKGRLIWYSARIGQTTKGFYSLTKTTKINTIEQLKQLLKALET